MSTFCQRSYHIKLILEDIFYSYTPFKDLHLVFIKFTCDFKMDWLLCLTSVPCKYLLTLEVIIMQPKIFSLLIPISTGVSSTSSLLSNNFMVVQFHFLAYFLLLIRCKHEFSILKSHHLKFGFSEKATKIPA